MAYLTLAAEAVCRLIISRSIFIARAREVADDNAVRAFLAEVKEADPKADHYPYAYRLGEGERAVNHCSDAGEPGGTAGRPILGALQAAGVTNAAVIVARYFGGKKLGIPGLIEAYRAAAAEALAKAGTVLRAPCSLMTLAIPYDRIETVRRMALRHHAEILSLEYAEQVGMRLRVPDEEANGLRDALAALGII